MEGSLHVLCGDSTLDPHSALAQGDNVVRRAFAQPGKPGDTMERMRERIEDAGVVKIQEKTYKIPIGGWAKNRTLKEAGRFNVMQFKAGMEGVSLSGERKVGVR